MSSKALPILQHSKTPLVLFSDYHMHPQGHRTQRYTQELLQPWADFARRLGLTDIAFTDHDRYHAGVDFDDMYADYFRRVRELIATGLVDALAHLDLIKIHGHRPTADIGTVVDETLEFIRARNLAVELSTAGWRKPVNELYPSDSIIKLALGKGIPFTTASDAHSHVQLGENFANLANKMAEIGIRQVCIFEKHKRAEVPLQL